MESSESNTPDIESDRISFRENRVLRLEESHLTRLFETAAKHVEDPVKTSARCSDHSKKVFSPPEKLLSYDNSSSRRITGLEIEGNKRRGIFYYFSVELNGDSTKNVSIVIQGDTETNERTRRRVKEILDDAKPWYSPLRRLDYSFFVILFLGLAMFGFVDSMSRSAELSKSYPTFWQYSVAMFTRENAWALPAALIAPFVMNYVRNRAFPNFVLLVGAGKSREQDANIWRVFFLGLIGSIVVAAAFSVWPH